MAIDLPIDLAADTGAVSNEQQNALDRMEQLQVQSMNFSIAQNALQARFESEMAGIEAQRNAAHAAAQAMKRGAAQMGQA